MTERHFELGYAYSYTFLDLLDLFRDETLSLADMARTIRDEAGTDTGLIYSEQITEILNKEASVMNRNTIALRISVIVLYAFLCILLPVIITVTSSIQFYGSV